MSDANTETQRAVILRLSGVSLEHIYAQPNTEKLINKGVMLRLEPALIAGPQNQEYQALTGRSPASFGFFDSLMPACHLAHTGRTAPTYTVVEERAGRDTPPAFLAERIQRAGWDVEQASCTLHEVSSTFQKLKRDTGSTPLCVFLTCRVEASTSANEVASALDAALPAIESWVTEQGLIALFSETQATHVKQFVNINNFLADMGIIERDEASDAVHWSESLAYYAGNGQLWINVTGREPQGAVQLQDEYEEVRESLIKALPNKLRDPETGESVIERVYRKEELYNGNFLFCAPDLVVMFNPGYAASPKSTQLLFDETVFSTPAPDTTVVAGTHPSQLNGFLLASAPALATKVKASSQLIALVPTLLHILGLAYTGIEASPVQEVFTHSYLETHPLKSDVQDQDLSEEDEELVINRLRDLGYI